MHNASFDESNTASIDSGLYFDTIAEYEKKERAFVFVIILLIVIFHGWFGYWLRYGHARVSGIDARPINIEDDPIQINYSDKEKKEKMFVYSSMINRNKITIIPQAHYEMSGMAVAYNHDFIFTNNFFDSAALYDLGTAWGKMGDKNFYRKYFKCYSQKNEIQGSRVLWTQPKTNPPALPREYSTSHYSHSHIVPANRNVMAALLRIKVWDKIKIEGELIDMQVGNWDYHTSMSRTDNTSMYGDRGNGSCETIYVTKVQIGKRIYK